VDLARLLTLALLYVVAPLWLLAGVLDYACHRQQRIERSAGLHESNLHLLMLGELGIGVLTALFLELNAAGLALLLVACVAHEFTMLRDLAYAQSRRPIPWFEQWVHGLQQALPWIAFAALVLLHWPQALALAGLGDAPAEWRLRLKSTPLPAWYVASFLGAAAVLVLVPFLSEWRRCRRLATALFR
jgi:hypothetical protein